MKVLVFTTQFYQLGGAERLAVELAEELNKRGIRADILSMYSEDLPGVAEARTTLLSKGIPAVHFLRMRIHPIPAGVLKGIFRLRRLIREEEYDVVETSMPGPTTIASFATWGSPTGHLGGLHAMYKKELFRAPKFKLLRLAVRFNHKTRFYAISKNVSGCWQEFSGLAENRIRVVYNGIAEDFFCAVPQRDQVRHNLGIPADGRIALFVGRLVKSKGIETLLDALGPILREENLYLLYVGGTHAPEGLYADEQGLLERMKKRIAQDSWSDRIRFLGRRNDVARLMASSDVLVHPAWFEGFGLVLAEAMAVGLPVVATNADAIPEVLEGSDYLVVPVDDALQLRQAVRTTLSRTPAQRREAERLGRKRAEHFRMARRVDEMNRTLNELVSGRF